MEYGCVFNKTIEAKLNLSILAFTFQASSLLKVGDFSTNKKVILDLKSVRVYRLCKVVVFYSHRCGAVSFDCI